GEGNGNRNVEGGGRWQGPIRNANQSDAIRRLRVAEGQVEPHVAKGIGAGRGREERTLPLDPRAAHPDLGRFGAVPAAEPPVTAPEPLARARASAVAYRCAGQALEQGAPGGDRGIADLELGAGIDELILAHCDRIRRLALEHAAERIADIVGVAED